jgi:N-methylhydantoinase B
MSPGGGIYIEHADGSRTFTSIAGQTLVRAGESWTGYSSGGGGWGHPCDRDAELVRRNLRDGIISEASARDICGVIVKDDFERTLDVEATEKHRAELRKIPRPMIEPTEPGAGKWMDHNVREGDRFIEAPTIAEHFSDK